MGECVADLEAQDGREVDLALALRAGTAERAILRAVSSLMCVVGVQPACIMLFILEPRQLPLLH